jgi:polyisoprenoid-binding protein YceI
MNQGQLVVLASLLSVAPAAAQRPLPAGKVIAGTLAFDGRATLGDFTGTTTTVGGAMTEANELRETRGWVEAPVATLQTGNGRRDRDLNKSLESDRFPALRFDLEGVTPHADAGDSAVVTLSGRLTIHGVTRPVSLPGTVRFGPEGIRVRSSFPLNLTDYRIGGLSKMLGVLKMHPDIMVRVDLLFGPGAGDGSPEASPGATRPLSG